MRYIGQFVHIFHMTVLFDLRLHSGFIVLGFHELRSCSAGYSRQQRILH